MGYINDVFYVLEAASYSRFQTSHLLGSISVCPLFLCLQVTTQDIPPFHICSLTHIHTPMHRYDCMTMVFVSQHGFKFSLYLSTAPGAGVFYDFSSANVLSEIGAWKLQGSSLCVHVWEHKCWFSMSLLTWVNDILSERQVALFTFSHEQLFCGCVIGRAFSYGKNLPQ